MWIPAVFRLDGFGIVSYVDSQVLSKVYSSTMGLRALALRYSRNGNAVKIRDGRAAVSVCSDRRSGIREGCIHCPPKADGKEPCGKTRVRKPACSRSHIVSVLAIWNACVKAPPGPSSVSGSQRSHPTVASLRGNGGFFLTAVGLAIWTGRHCRRSQRW